MKLLFFSTAALMTVAYASKIAQSISSPSSMWIEEVVPCEGFDNPRTIYNIYNFYY